MAFGKFIGIYQYAKKHINISSSFVARTIFTNGPQTDGMNDRRTHRVIIGHLMIFLSVSAGHAVCM